MIGRYRPKSHTKATIEIGINMSDFDCIHILDECKYVK